MRKMNERIDFDEREENEEVEKITSSKKTKVKSSMKKSGINNI